METVNYKINWNHFGTMTVNLMDQSELGIK